tara:strand:- start:1770 stop:2126 length:357 start_codon:yes stop_codon:yes gene_type:complete
VLRARTVNPSLYLKRLRTRELARSAAKKMSGAGFAMPISLELTIVSSQRNTPIPSSEVLADSVVLPVAIANGSRLRKLRAISTTGRNGWSPCLGQVAKVVLEFLCNLSCVDADALFCT